MPHFQFFFLCMNESYELNITHFICLVKIFFFFMNISCKKHKDVVSYTQINCFGNGNGILRYPTDILILCFH